MINGKESIHVKISRPLSWSALILEVRGSDDHPTFDEVSETYVKLKRTIYLVHG